MTKTFDLFESAGYVVGQLDRLRAEPGATELRVRAADLPDSVVTFALQHDEAATYRFIVTAVPNIEARRPQKLETRGGLKRSRKARVDRDAVVAALDAELSYVRETIHASYAELTRAHETIHTA
jgi:hypothetical protein